MRDDGCIRPVVDITITIAAMILIAAMMSMVIPASSAPRIEKATDDTITGAFEWQTGKCGTVVFGDTRYWLVFQAEPKERMLDGLENGSRVRVTGKAGQGGQYRYWNTSAIERVE